MGNFIRTRQVETPVVEDLISAKSIRQSGQMTVGRYNRSPP